eukprot:4817812-Pleurochrysis_carterae.AAC.1
MSSCGWTHGSRFRPALQHSNRRDHPPWLACGFADLLRREILRKRNRYPSPKPVWDRSDEGGAPSGVGRVGGTLQGRDG